MIALPKPRHGPRPIQRAMEAWRRMNPQGDFGALLAGYLTVGFLYNGDDAFICAVPQGDQWFVHLAAGDLSRFQTLAPYKLPFVAWQRRGTGPVRRHSWEKFRRHTQPD